MVNKVGKPPKIKSPEEMQTKVDAYFKHCEEEGEHPTITGLAIGLGFVSRQSLLDYAKMGEYSCTIKAAKARVERYIEQRLYDSNPTGCIFNLKNNFGWKDKVEQDVNHGVQQSFTDLVKDLAQKAKDE